MTTRIAAALVVAIIGASAGPAVGASERLRPPVTSAARVEALPVAQAVKLDGEFVETAWARATAVRDFVQRDPKEGAAPTFATEVRVLYDANYLYVGVWAFDDDREKSSGSARGATPIPRPTGSG